MSFRSNETQNIHKTIKNALKHLHVRTSPGQSDLIVDTVNAHDSALGHMGYPN